MAGEAHQFRFMMRSVNPSRLYREKLLGMFMQEYLPSEEQLALIDLASSFSWLQAATSLAEPGTALSYSLSSLALTKIGRKSGDQRLLIQGLNFHGRALRELQKALWDPELMWRDETLAAAKTLAVYELYENSVNLRSWTSHEEGIRRLYRLRGPQQHTSPLACLLYDDFRFTSMIQGIQYRKSLYLEESEWTTTPWHGRLKGPEQRLYDIGFSMAAMLEFVDKMGGVEDADKKLEKRWQLLHICQELHERMTQWYEGFLQESPNPPYWTIEPAPDDMETSVYPFPAAFQFPSLRVALPILTFWALQLVLSGTVNLHLLSQLQPSPIWDMGRILDGSGPCNHAKSSVSFMLDVARNVAQSVPYLMHPDMGTLTAQRIIFPLRVAMGIYRLRPGPELTWFKSVFQTIARKKGIAFGQGIANAG